MSLNKTSNLIEKSQDGVLTTRAALVTDYFRVQGIYGIYALITVKF